MGTRSIFWYVFVAAIGGAIVFAGLLMEQCGSIKSHQNIRRFRFCEQIKFWGEWLVVIGVLLETVVAGISAVDEWQTRQEIAKNTPRHLNLAQIRLLEGNLSSIPNKPWVRIFLNENVLDSETLGNQLSMAFMNSGFKFRGFLNGVHENGTHGIFVSEFEGSKTTASAIVFSLRAAGLTAETNSGFMEFSNDVFISIEYK